MAQKSGTLPTGLSFGNSTPYQLQYKTPISKTLVSSSILSVASVLRHPSKSFVSDTMSTAELACSYAAMILQDDGIAVTAEKIAALVKSANVAVESYWPGLFAKLAEKKNLEDLFLNACASGGSAPVAVTASAGGAGGAASAAAPAVEEKKEEAKEESDDDMGFSLFD